MWEKKCSKLCKLILVLIYFGNGHWRKVVDLLIYMILVESKFDMKYLFSPEKVFFGLYFDKNVVFFDLFKRLVASLFTQEG